MYTLLISMVITLLVVALMPGDRDAFDPLDFMNPRAAARTAEAEVHAHSMSVFAEAVMARLAEFPESLPRYPDAIRVDQLDRNRRYAPVLPRDYRPTMPWQAYLLPAREPADSDAGPGGIDGVGAVVAFVNPAYLPPDVRAVDVAFGLRLTAGGDVPVGLLRNGQLLTQDFSKPNVINGFGTIHDLPSTRENQNAPAIVVCLDNTYCGG